MEKPEIKLNSTPTYATTEHMLQKARENEAKGIPTTVYDWTFPKVLDQPIPMREVAPNVTRLRKLTLKLVQKNPSWDNEAVREHIKRNHEDFKDMADRTHPHLFLMLTDKGLTDQNFNRIKELLAIRYLHEQSGNLEKNTEMISAYFQQQFHLPAPQGASKK
jgi:hypothetical protein